MNRIRPQEIKSCAHYEYAVVSRPRDLGLGPLGKVASEYIQNASYSTACM